MEIPRRLGPFLLTRRIGAGGMGTVYYGTMGGPDGPPAAVKIIRAELADHPEFRARFRREIEVVRRVAGACTARVLAADPDGDPPYLATEYLAGPSLAEYVRQHGPLAGDSLRTLAVGLAEALVAIHDAGVVHRDLKPSNVLLTREGPRVVDFGIAQAVDTVSLTGAGSSVGSPAYMSPEQISGRFNDPAMDVFAWGCTVAYAATGRSPFGGGSADAVLFRVRHDPANLDGVPGRLYGLLARALAKNAQARPDIRALLRELLALSDVGPTVSSDAEGTDLTALVNEVIAAGWLSTAHLDARILDLDTQDVELLPIVRAPTPPRPTPSPSASPAAGRRRPGAGVPPGRSVPAASTGRGAPLAYLRCVLPEQRTEEQRTEDQRTGGAETTAPRAAPRMDTAAGTRSPGGRPAWGGTTAAASRRAAFGAQHAPGAQHVPGAPHAPGDQQVVPEAQRVPGGRVAPGAPAGTVTAAAPARPPRPRSHRAERRRCRHRRVGGSHSVRARSRSQAVGERTARVGPWSVTAAVTAATAVTAVTGSFGIAIVALAVLVLMLVGLAAR
ncbi:serine/threonine-protein kinase [Frankia sp. CcI49]|uniref:serine/threonine-protein kinase n=1 Tax=Frankia sp. CcI49 TaxID=1745382 RepID=UPI0010549CB9|nr:serine/threonine-protein kinase [Frankia sp. CcI49]